jgi:hypothetical protein
VGLTVGVSVGVSVGFKTGDVGTVVGEVVGGTEVSCEVLGGGGLAWMQVMLATGFSQR